MATGADHLAEAFHGRLRAVRRRKQWARALHGTLLTLLVVLCAVMAAVVAEGLLVSGVTVRTVLFWTLLAGGALLLAWKAGIPLLRLAHILPEETDMQTALEVGRTFPAVGDRLLNGLQLLEERRTQARSYSVELIDAALADLNRETAGLAFTDAVSFLPAGRAARALGIAAACAALLVVAVPGFLLGSAGRLLRHGEVYASPLSFTLSVEPGDVEVVKGDTVRISVRAAGGQPERIVLLSRPEGQMTFEERVLLPGRDGVFRHTIPALRTTLLYAASAGDVRTPEYRLTVQNRPAVRTFRVTLEFPRYTAMAARPQEDNVGDVTALRGTRIRWRVEATKDLGHAAVVFNDSTRLALGTERHVATGALVLMRDRTYHLELQDRNGVSSADPIEYVLRALPDAFPVVSLPVPGMNLSVTDADSLLLVVRISDDFGFSRLRLAYRRAYSRYDPPSERSSYVELPLPGSAVTDAAVQYVWQLAPLALGPEDVVEYYAEVYDNDEVSGPKMAVSQTYQLRLPSLDEVFAEIDSGHAAAMDILENTLRQAEEARERLQELEQDLRTEQNRLEWQAQQRADELRKLYENMQRTVDEAARTIDELTAEMKNERLLSPETLQKYQELQRLMEEISSPELAQAMARLQETLQRLSPEAMRDALQRMNMTEESFRQSIERTLNLLKRIQIEQKVDELVKRTDELLRQQDEVRQQTERLQRADSTGATDLARRQEDIGNDMEKLRKELKELQAGMEQFPREMPLDELRQAAQELESQELEADLEQSMEQLQGENPAEAARSQQQVAQRLERFRQRMREMKQSLQQNQMQAIVGEMRSIQRDLLELSRRQEDLKNQSRGLAQNSPGFRENAQSQVELGRDLGNLANRMGNLSQKTFGVTPEMGKVIGDALRSMEQALQSLEQRNGQGASGQQQAAMGSLNEAAQMMQNAMAAMMQGGGQGMGMAGFLERLRQLGGMQQSINEQTQQLSLSQEQAAAMARLAGEQGMVRKSLEQLAREAAAAGELSKTLGDLNRVAQEMREVQTDLAGGNVSPETLRKQERILSRMLDSQRSMRERDFEKRRRSESGTTVARRSPGPLDLSTDDGKNRLRRDLLKALEEGYARDYQELIRKYFEALER